MYADIVDQKAKETKAYHGAVDRDSREDIVGLERAYDAHRYEDDGIALSVDLGSTDGRNDKDDHQGKEYAVADDPVELLPEVRHQTVILHVLEHHRLDAESMLCQGIDQYLDSVDQEEVPDPFGRFLEIRRAAAVVACKAEELIHEEIHADGIDIVADKGYHPDVGRDDDEITEDRGYAGDIEPSYRSAQYLVMTPRISRTEHQTKYQ